MGSGFGNGILATADIKTSNERLHSMGRRERQYECASCTTEIRLGGKCNWLNRSNQAGLAFVAV